MSEADHLIFPILHTCKYLRLIPTEKDLPEVRTIMEILNSGRGGQEIADPLERLLGNPELGGRRFRAECLKMKACCVITASVVISEETYLLFLMANNPRLVACESREILMPTPFLPKIQWILKAIDTSEKARGG